MDEPLAVALKFGFLVVLYLFLLWVARSAMRDLSRYEAGSGRSMSDVRWYMTLALWKSAIFLEGSYKRRLAGTTEDPFFDLLKQGVPDVADRAWNTAQGRSA